MTGDVAGFVTLILIAAIGVAWIVITIIDN